MNSGSKYNLARWRPIAIDDLVRVGRRGDGGYVISQRSVAATDVLLGLGIFDDWSFERAFLATHPEVSVVGVDGSVSSRIFRRKAGEAAVLAAAGAATLRIAYMKHHLALARRWARAARAFDEFFGQGSATFMRKFLAEHDAESFITWNSLRPSVLGGSDTDTPNVFVKMDIEGSEYRVLADVLSDASRFSGMIVEFHDVDVHWERFVELMDTAQQQLAVVHIHGNNYAPLIRGSDCPQALEISFVNRRLLSGAAVPSTRTYPVPMLDEPCDPDKPDYTVPV